MLTYLCFVYHRSNAPLLSFDGGAYVSLVPCMPARSFFNVTFYCYDMFYDILLCFKVAGPAGRSPHVCESQRVAQVTNHHPHLRCMVASPVPVAERRRSWRADIQHALCGPERSIGGAGRRRPGAAPAAAGAACAAVAGIADALLGYAGISCASSSAYSAYI